jgi:hypothetical protein
MVSRHTLVLMAMLDAALSSVCGVSIAWAADSPRVAKAHLTADQVSSLAKAELRRAAQADNFKARTPTYQPEKRQWWVFFIQSGSPVSVDGDILAVVDDRSTKVCLQQPIADGPCT